MKIMIYCTNEEKIMTETSESKLKVLCRFNEPSKLFRMGKNFYVNKDRIIWIGFGEEDAENN